MSYCLERLATFLRDWVTVRSEVLLAVCDRCPGLLVVLSALEKLLGESARTGGDLALDWLMKRPEVSAWFDGVAVRLTDDFCARQVAEFERSPETYAATSEAMVRQTTALYGAIVRVGCCNRIGIGAVDGALVIFEVLRRAEEAANATRVQYH
jgi:hypothetical protein